MEEPSIRTMTREDWSGVAALICHSTNAWYESHSRPPIFTGGPDGTMLFCRVYEALDPGCCLIAEDPESGLVIASCFYHPRPTHISLGIMNVHPDWFGRSVASRLLRRVTDIADAAGLPTRLVSSAINLDSYSLYTRAGFTPGALYQDMFIPVPETGLGVGHPALASVRDATPADLPAIVALEERIQHIRREKDWACFLENADGIWSVSVCEGRGGIDGCLASVADPGSRMLGPGVCRTPHQAAALILAQLDKHRGHAPVFLIPSHESDLVAMLYGWGARNCELHIHQVRGDHRPPDGIAMPTFMPETA